MRLARATVRAVLSAEDDLQTVEVSCEGATALAYNYLNLGRPLVSGDEVVLNTTAIDLKLGTGNVHFVVPNSTDPSLNETGEDADGKGADGEGADGKGADGKGADGKGADGKQPALSTLLSSGHIIKLRYTPLQLNVLAVEEAASPEHELLKEARSVAGMPVVCCALHSQMPLVAAAVRSLVPKARIAYCMTDQGALPLAYSQLVRRARSSQLIDISISCGQAFGGDLEAVTLYSGLLAAHHVAHADVAIVAIGPGNVGTATAFGHTGVAQGLALNAAAALDGVPICALRVSFADARERHRGVSWHSLTALTTVCLAEAIVALCDRASLASAQHACIEQALEQAGIYSQHGVVELPVARERINLHGLNVTHMGRDEATDPAFFQTSYAAGILAGKLIGERRRSA